MEIQELRELKQYVLDKFQNTKDKNLKAVLRHIDKIIKRKIIDNNLTQKKIFDKIEKNKTRQIKKILIFYPR